MQHVNLSGNNICNKAADFLSIAIDNNIYLQHLELANCFIKEVVNANLDFASINTGFEHLNLSFCELLEVSMVDISK